MGLNLEIQRKITHILQHRTEIRFAFLYGSAAEDRPFRDVDIALFVDRATVLPENDWDYACDVADELEKVVPYPVDVRVINHAPLSFRYQVSRGTPLFVRDRPALFCFLERTWDLFFDFQPTAMQYLKEQV